MTALIIKFCRFQFFAQALIYHFCESCKKALRATTAYTKRTCQRFMTLLRLTYFSLVNGVLTALGFAGRTINVVLDYLRSIKMPGLTLPEFKAPKLPSISIAPITLPQINAPKWKAPTIKKPQFPALPKITFNPRLVRACVIVVVFVGLTGIASALPYEKIAQSKPNMSFFNGMNFDFADLSSKDPSQIEPSSGDPFTPVSAQTAEGKNDTAYPVEDRTLDVEGVLVPQKTTVISSSRDGQIKSINFDDGDLFSKDDILVEYDCDDLKAEMDALEAENELTIKKGDRGEKLFKLEIISDIERMDLLNDASKAQAQKRILEARMQNCAIRAAYDGRVVERLANDHEYTRTDRVLMEVGSLDNLEVEFLLPSKWLRWINIGAPLKLTLFETGREYTAQISRIHGEVDPVSQSIQATAALDPYDDPLLPGMSGSILIDISEIREAGIHGYLERPAP